MEKIWNYGKHYSTMKKNYGTLIYYGKNSGTMEKNFGTIVKYGIYL